MPKITWPRALVLLVLFGVASAVVWWALEERKMKATQAALSQAERERTRVIEPLGPRPASPPVLFAEEKQDISPPAPAKKAAVPARGGYVRLVAELLRAFPRMPSELEPLCARSDHGGSVEFVCRKGLDAPVHYVLAKDATWATLAILGPPGVRDRLDCREWLVSHAKGAQSFGTRQKNDELQMYFARDDLRFVASYLTATPKGSGAPCSILACREDGRGNGEGCRKPAD